MKVRTSVSEGRGFDFVISDDSRDRHGTRLNPTGWDLGAFKRNPIALFGHSNGFPIGRWEDVRVEGNKLLGRLVMAAKGTSARIDEIASLVEQGILRAVSVGFSVLEYGTPGKSTYDYEKQELLEVSVVSVPSNTNAIAAARGMGVSDDTLSLVFGEHAEAGRDRATAGGGNAAHATRAAQPPQQKAPQMKTLSQRIEDAQNNLNAKRDTLTELSAAENLDVDAVEALSADVEQAERALNALKAVEQRIGVNAAKPAAPNVNRRPLAATREVSGLDLIVRAVAARGISHFGNKPLAQVLEERYPGHEPTAIMARADQTIGTTGVAGWASEIVQTGYADFLQALTGVSIYPQLRQRGIGLSFDGQGTVSIPSRTAGGAGGGFVAEGSPIRVGRITTAATTMTARKMGVIVPFSRELAKRSTPMIEALVRQAILEDSAAILDAALLDATAESTARPAGLLNGVSAAATGYGGGDAQSVMEDFKALLGPFITANAADNITVVMNPIQGLALAMLLAPDGRADWFNAVRQRVTIVESTYATAGRLVALRNSDFATALGDAPEFDVSEQAVVHMEDTTPLEVVSGTGPTTADPVRSFFQTGTIGVRMLMDVSWKMRRSGMVQWINGTSW
jgi:HK97 family phage major capsid protein/HK97 family phage prohead protease